MSICRSGRHGVVSLDTRDIHLLESAEDVRRFVKRVTGDKQRFGERPTFICRWTAAAAREMLSYNTRNRNLMPMHLKQLTNEILDGMFYLSDDSASLCDDGTMGNGQHRFVSLCLADSKKPGVTMDMKLGFGMPRHVADMCADRGKHRTPSQVLQFLGEGDATAAELQFFVNAPVAPRGGTPGARELEDLRGVAERYINAAKQLLDGTEKKRTRAPFVAAIARALLHESYDDVQEFVEAYGEHVTNPTGRDLDAMLYGVRAAGERVSGADRRERAYRATEEAIYEFCNGERKRSKTTKRPCLYPLPDSVEAVRSEWIDKKNRISIGKTEINRVMERVGPNGRV